MGGWRMKLFSVGAGTPSLPCLCGTDFGDNVVDCWDGPADHRVVPDGRGDNSCRSLLWQSYSLFSQEVHRPPWSFVAVRRVGFTLFSGTRGVTRFPVGLGSKVVFTGTGATFLLMERSFCILHTRVHVVEPRLRRHGPP